MDVIFKKQTNKKKYIDQRIRMHTKTGFPLDKLYWDKVLAQVVTSIESFPKTKSAGSVVVLKDTREGDL